MNSLNDLNKMPSKASIELAAALMKRLFPSPNSSNEKSSSEVETTTKVGTSVEEQLKIPLEAPTSELPEAKDFVDNLRQQMRLI
ncbi:hypothetical protein X975_06505, partial [Stegodyphus mimosarum]